MTKGINKVILLGRVGDEPKSFTGGKNILVTLSVATTKSIKKDDKRVDETEWHNCVAFRSNAKFIADYINKGDTVYIEGFIKSSKYKGTDGVEKSRIQIVIDRVECVSKANKKQYQKTYTPEEAQKKLQEEFAKQEQSKTEENVFDDDIPF